MKYYGISLENRINIQSIMSFYHFYFDENYKSNGEQHNFWELVFVKNGSIGVTADTKFYELTKGMAIFHKPNEFHKLWSSGGTKPEILVCSFSCDDKLLNGLVGKVVKLNCFEETLLQNITEFLEQNTVCGLENHNNHIFKLNQNVNIADLQVVKTELELLLLKLNNNISVDSKVLTANLTVTHEDIFNNTINFLKSNIGENITVSDICKQINVSSATLKRIFKKYAGESVKKYFLLLKIQKSKEMLRSGMQIGQISEVLGFSSQNYFCYAFKREIGVTPFLYKNKGK